MSYNVIYGIFEFKLFEFKIQNDTFKKFKYKIWMVHYALDVYLGSPTESQ